jgi:hypothetical protein
VVEESDLKVRGEVSCWVLRDGVPVEHSHVKNLVVNGSRPFFADLMRGAPFSSSIKVIAIGDSATPAPAITQTQLVSERFRTAVAAADTDTPLSANLLDTGGGSTKVVLRQELKPFASGAGIGYPTSPPQVTFEIAGAQPAIDAFWAYVRAREAATGKALANYLDVRPNPDGDPTPSSLPATINPLEFACEHLLRRGTFLVEVATGSLRSMAFFDFLPYFRKFLPPGRLMLLVIVLSSVEDSIIMTTDEEVAVEAGVPDIEDASNEPFADAVALAPRSSDG